jgi:hypothetical protein
MDVEDATVEPSRHRGELVVVDGFAFEGRSRGKERAQPR